MPPPLPHALSSLSCRPYACYSSSGASILTGVSSLCRCALTDEESTALRESLNRVQGSMSSTLAQAKELNAHHIAENTRLRSANEKLKV